MTHHSILRSVPRPAARAFRVVASIVLLAAACRPDAASGPAADEAPVVINAALAGTDIRTLSVQVSGPAIHEPIVASVDIPGEQSMAMLTLDVPVGAQRTFVARGYDEAGMVTHEGLATATVRPSGNAPVAIRMFPRTGDVPITVGVGEYTLTMTPGAPAEDTVGHERQLSARVVDGDGTTVTAATVLWGSLNPSVAGVGPTGRVVARSPGVTTIVASSRGAVSSVELVVTRPSLSFMEIAAGADFTCALDGGGAAWCWGANDEGQLGDGTTTDRLRPVPVRTAARFQVLVAGPRHVCGFNYNLDAWCWGSNDSHQLASVSTPWSSVPVRVPGAFDWILLFTGERATCGLATDYETYCWGTGVPGRLGLSGPPPHAAVRTPTLVPAAPHTWATVAIGSRVSCGVNDRRGTRCDDDGSVHLGSGGEFDGWVDFGLEDLARSGDGRREWQAVAPFACGLVNNRTLYCWGSNSHGQLGRGTGPPDTGSPREILGGHNWDHFSLGGSFACGSRFATAYCWGRNDLGQLGDGTVTNRAEQTPVGGGHQFGDITAGLAHACALSATTGRAFCWGANEWGMLGDGTTERRLSPVAVRPPLPDLP
jgi:alpha-tubulin suppressor-like RCC1 family protein